MITLLRKIFIKNYKNIEDEKVRAKHGLLASFFGIFSNLVLVVLKLVFGIISMSVSIVGDSINNLADLGSSFITLIGFKISSKPADKKHPYGHQRMEYISGLIVSVVILALAVELLIQSIERIINNTSTNYTMWTLIILGICIAIKLIQGFFNLRMAKIIKSIALKATALDSFTDCIATSAVLIAGLIAYFSKVNIDGYMGIVVALFVSFTGVKMLLSTINPLLGEAIEKKDIEKITNKILSYPGILGIHDLMCHNYGPTKFFVSVHCEVDCKDDFLAIHEVIDNIEHDIKSEFGVDLVIHMDPIDTSNVITLQLKEKALNILKNIDNTLSMHDFRVVHGKEHTNILFDIVIPFDCKKKEEDIKNTLINEFNKGEIHKYNFIINFDRPFIE